MKQRSFLALFHCPRLLVALAEIAGRVEVNDKANKCDNFAEKRSYAVRWGIAGTLVYLGVIGWFFWCEILLLRKSTSLNEVGDFLAGVFAPLAFLWLVVSLFLQRKELQLQRIELGQARLQWEKVGKQADADYAARFPKLLIPACYIRNRPYADGSSPEAAEFGPSICVSAIVRNKGNVAFDVALEFDAPSMYDFNEIEIQKIEKHSREWVNFDISLFALQKGGEFNLKLECNDNSGGTVKTNYAITVDSSALKQYLEKAKASKNDPDPSLYLKLEVREKKENK